MTIRLSYEVSHLLMFYMASERLSRLHMFMIPRVIILARRVLCNVNDSDSFSAAFD